MDRQPLGNTVKDMEGLQRIIGRFGSSDKGPTVVAVAGMHGNERAGVVALARVFTSLSEKRPPFRGQLVGLAGNMAALDAQVRFLQRDLNRMWKPTRVADLRRDQPAEAPEAEELEQRELLEILDQVFATAPEVVYCLDLHTTSSYSVPFSVLGDSLGNRSFALKFPVPIVLGLEESIDGALLEYANSLGHITLGFEGGQHTSASSSHRIEAAVWLALVAAGCLAEKDIPSGQDHRQMLHEATRHLPRIMEVRHRHSVTPGDEFEMQPGYQNFQAVDQGELLARDHTGDIRTQERGRILMPLYQTQGDDGYFLVRPVSSFWLGLSTALRRMRVHKLVHLLPGVRRHPHRANTLIVDRHVARWVAVELFHLLGFRKRRAEEGMLVVSKREGDW